MSKRVLLIRAISSIFVSAFAFTFASATWTVTNLTHSSGEPICIAWGASPTSIVGEVRSQSAINKASLWDPAGATWINLNPPGAEYSAAHAATATRQGGMAYVNNASRAVLWTGSAASWIDLHPAGGDYSVVRGMSDVDEVGECRINNKTRAIRWTGSAGSWTDLNPDDSYYSIGYATSGTEQVGYVVQADGIVRASRWLGTKESWVDLSPPASEESMAYGTDGSTQVGFIKLNNVRMAHLWRGDWISGVSLHPEGAENSQARAVLGDRQVGFVRMGATMATVWSGTADSWIELHSLLPGNYSSSQALAIATDGERDYIAGSAYNWTTQKQEGIVWSQARRFVSGTVSFGGAPELASVRMQFRHANTGALIPHEVEVPIAGDGSFSLRAPGGGDYQLVSQPKGFLRRVVNTNTVASSLSGIQVQLIPGEIVVDGVIDIGDYVKLALNFGKMNGDWEWDNPDSDGITASDCDLTRDGIVDIADYVLLSTNFSAVGD